MTVCEARRTRRAPRKRMRGGQLGNQNARRRKPHSWNEQFHLKDRENTEAFIVHMVKLFWAQNPLDARAAGALNNMLRLYCDMKGWITKVPIQVFQSQMTLTTQAELDLEKVVRSLPLEVRDQIFREWRKQVAREISAGNPDDRKDHDQMRSVGISSVSVSSNGLGKLASEIDIRDSSDSEESFAAVT